MMIVIDAESRKEAESAANGTHWAGRGGVFAIGTHFLVSFLENVSTIVRQAKKLPNHTQASRSAQLNDQLVQTPKLLHWKNPAFPISIQ